MGPPRHLALLPESGAQRIEWPVPFADGVDILLRHRGTPCVVLASGDPFWFGAGSVLARSLSAEEWRCFPGPSTFSLAASEMGWPLERTPCLGLHAAPLGRLRPHLAPGNRAIVLLRDGGAVGELAEWLTELGFDDSTLTIMESLGGPRQRVRRAAAQALAFDDIAHPVCVALEVAGTGAAMPAASGRPDTLFESDGQITKRPVRALTLSALAPLPGQHLWDIGAGSGSIAIEWLLAHPDTSATAVEMHPERAERIRLNADQLGADRLNIVTGTSPNALIELDKPDCVFVGGGLSEEVLSWLHANLAPGTRIVANAVTLETEALVMTWQQRLGGDLLRIELAQAAPLGTRRGWKAAYPIVQWSVVL